MTGEKADSGIIFNIQRYAIHDGPGIRTTVFFKGCPLRCFWCQNPESQSKKPEIFLNKDQCILCGSCVAVCPTKASSLAEDSSIINRSLCTGCGKCTEVCPTGARTLVGKYITVDEIIQEVIRDKPYYVHSGGGITLSGGDPVLQPGFALSLLKNCKQLGLHTVIDTCGYTSWTSLKKLLEFTDLVLYDIKCINPEKHSATTGKSNNLVLKNAIKVAGYRPMRIRVPIIADFNDSPDVIREIAYYIKAKLGGADIDLLPYNKLGEGKYRRLDRPYIHQQDTDEERIEELKSIIDTMS